MYSLMLGGNTSAHRMCFLFRSILLMQFTKLKESLQRWMFYCSEAIALSCALYEVVFAATQINIRKTWTQVGKLLQMVPGYQDWLHMLHAIISNKNALSFDLKIIAQM